MLHLEQSHRGVKHQVIKTHPVQEEIDGMRLQELKLHLATQHLVDIKQDGRRHLKLTEAEI
jgi:hypothetical protein